MEPTFYLKYNSTANASACTIPNFGAFFCHRGAKWISMQIFPPRYILAVRPSNDGSSISIGVSGYVAGIYLKNVMINLEL
jgi:hypothetical protein